MTEQTIIQVKSDALPLSCPNRQTDVAMAHPRVFIPLKAGETSVCPYCGATYQLEADA